MRFLGKQGLVTAQLKSLGQLSAEQRPAAGKLINEAKQLIDRLIQLALEEHEAKNALKSTGF